MKRIPVRLEDVRVEGEGIIGGIGVYISVQCLECCHFRAVGISCNVFPDGIPEEIYEGNWDHTKPFPGDQGIRFTPRVKT